LSDTTATPAHSSNAPPSNAPASHAWRVVGIAGLVTLVVAALSHLLPVDWSGTCVGIAFLSISYELVIRKGSIGRVRHFGLSFGGVVDPQPIEWRRLTRETSVALLWALGTALIVFPPFLVGFIGWWRPAAGFRPAPLLSVLEDSLGQLLMVALPEEAFYRGYLQTSLDDCWSKRWRFFGGYISVGIVVASAIFALGHLLTEPQPNRLAVFFPSLLFGWLRTRTRGVGASIFLHAISNLYSAYLGRSFGMWS